jgi:hypothetical protein
MPHETKDVLYFQMKIGEVGHLIMQTWILFNYWPILCGATLYVEVHKIIMKCMILSLYLALEFFQPMHKSKGQGSKLVNKGQKGCREPLKTSNYSRHVFVLTF